MLALFGCRDVKVFNGVTSGTLEAGFVGIEVTNANGTDVVIYLNDQPTQGHPTNGIPSQGIPVKAGTTREIPMQVYNFTATGVVTVVAYKR